MDDLADRIIADIERLQITEGRLQGEPFTVLPWQRDVVEGVANHTVAALSVARANGKSTLMAGLACSAILPEGALFRPRGEVSLVASSLQQGRILFNHILGFIIERLDEDNARCIKGPKTWRIIDNSHQAGITHRPTGARLMVRGSDARRAHGMAPSLLICDEPAKWERGGRDMWAALRTSMGKQVDGKIVVIGTQSDQDDHWFTELLATPPGGSVFVRLYTADPEIDDFDEDNVRSANPSLEFMPDLQTALDEEAALAMDGGPPLAMWRALRLNLGTPEVADRELLLRVEDWAAVTTINPGPREGPVAIGVDLGDGFSMSAVAFYWPKTGRLEGYGGFPAQPSLREHGKIDYVGDRYVKMHERGELFVYPGKATNNGQFLHDMFSRLRGMEVLGLAADRYKRLALDQAVVSAGLPIHPSEIQYRGVGTGPDGNADIVAFQMEVREAHLNVAPNLALESAIGDAIIRRVNGNAALNKSRHKGRIDVLQAAILAAGVGRRWRVPSEAQRAFDIADFWR